jgi:hypothetical protein
MPVAQGLNHAPDQAVFASLPLMGDWTADELDRIAVTDELQLASERTDGNLRKPVTVWVVRRGDDLYVRSAYGAGSKWFTGIHDRHEGHISAGGVEKDVRFVEAGDDVNDAVDDAYRTKYAHYDASLVDPMMQPEVRRTTLRLDAR